MGMKVISLNIISEHVVEMNGALFKRTSYNTQLGKQEKVYWYQQKLKKNGQPYDRPCFENMLLNTPDKRADMEKLFKEANK